MQTATQKFVSKCNKVALIVDNDMALGELHDFIMLLKGVFVEKMVAAHQQQMAEMKAQMPQEPSAEPAEVVNL